MKKSIAIILLVLIADQVLKIWVKTHMTIGEEIYVFGNWFIIHFTENEGMAFGLRFGGNFGKLLLSIFRIIAIILIGWYLFRLTRTNAKTGLIISLSLIFAGALGNILDSAFYGLIFSESRFHEVATLMPPGGGYNSFLAWESCRYALFPGD